MNFWPHQFEPTGTHTPWLFLGIFIAASLLMIWRLEALSANGFEGTVLGTLIMPYCSGAGNLLFTFIIAKNQGPGAEVMTNALVNNLTNLTLLIGLPVLLWPPPTAAGPRARPGRSRRKPTAVRMAAGLNRLSVLLTLLALLFFTGATWALGRDGRLTFNEGLVLVGLFLFWQTFHVFEVLKRQVGGGRKALTWSVSGELVLLGLATYASYVSIDGLVNWLNTRPAGFLSRANLGWLSGWLTVLPNAFLALYYGWRRKPEVVFTSQIGDGHICIPLCIGIYALFRPLDLPPVFLTSMYLLTGVTVAQLFFIGALGRLPRWVGGGLILAYGYFVQQGLLN
ncbi:MAG TPA: sodium:calcium symporter [Verrucomicrobiota bacterium]|nr:sodium:calcium symporter [Verrucomicrobiota bacterium]HNT15121.1 sodium:calcium symporter [Verrucomicrobiota bacterium]